MLHRQRRANMIARERKQKKLYGNKEAMYVNFNNGFVSDDFNSISRLKHIREMYFAMYAYEIYGNATRDNTFVDLVELGLELEESGGAE
jgi:hypothetical protein